MTITNEDELAGLQAIGRIVANTLQAMARAAEPGMTTAELDAIGRDLLAREGEQSAPETTYGFPGATCISVNEEIAHGIPGPRVIAAGDLVNIDVSASKDGYFADTGATFRIGPVSPALDRLCRDGRRAMQIGAKSPNPLYDPQLASFSMEGFDVTAACTGFIVALNVGANYIVSGQCKRVALVCPERVSSWSGEPA